VSSAGSCGLAVRPPRFRKARFAVAAPDFLAPLIAAQGFFIG
jgi:hypothetical protein